VDANVLIVDDSSVMVDTLNTILASQGFRVRSCASGEAGWEHLMAGVQGSLPMPDVLLLDLNMPGLDGMSLLDRIRSEERFASLSIIIVTAESDSSTRTRALGAGANDYMCKPVDVSELLERVKLWSNGGH
jgi:DNA-binding response OmpR family regulator